MVTLTVEYTFPSSWYLHAQCDFSIIIVALYSLARDSYVMDTHAPEATKQYKYDFYAREGCQKHISDSTSDSFVSN